MSDKSKFEILSAIDVTQHIEKKGNLSYLSWAWAVDQLLRADPAATWSYNQPTLFGETMMVNCTVTAFGKNMSMQLPVMDFRNKAIASPDAFAVNTAMMRCLVKAIALHGLGLYIYAGEDLPLNDDGSAETKPPAAPASAKAITKDVWDTMPEATKRHLQGIADVVREHLNAEDIGMAVAALKEVTDADEKTAIWSRFESKERTAIKAYKPQGEA